MSISEKKKNLTDQLYDTLEDSILSGKIPTGTQLKPGLISQEHGLSLSVAREALSRLVNDGLVEQHSNRGFFVITLSKKHLSNLVEARKINELTALKQACDLEDLEWESRLIAAFHKLDHYTQGLSDDTFHEWRAAHREFHASLLSGCDNTVLLSICEKLWKMSELYRAQAMRRDADRDSGAEHRALLDAVIARDKDRVVKIYEQHIDRTLQFVIEDE